MHTADTVSLTAHEQERLLAILNSWHKIEFFIPFDLEGSVIDQQTRRTPVLKIFEQDLHQGDDAFRFKELEPGKTAKYELYIGVFDKNEIAPICDSALGLNPSSKALLENQERGDLEGLTCYAKLKLTEQKEPIFDEVSVSTLPWTLGVIQHSGLDGLSAESFAQAKAELSGKLLNHASRRDTGYPLQPLTSEELIELRNLFYDWAGFTPGEEKMVAVLRQRILDKHDTQEDTIDANDTGEELEPEIDILNSFYIQDIERAMREIAGGKISSSLYHYLTPLDSSEKVDLYSEVGKQALLEKLHPRLFNRGHWFDPPEHLMSLMQQFAINTAFETNEKSGIFSVNGPPGTGKTTLIKDLIAENIVRRASALASLNTASEAFVGKHGSIPIKDKTFKAAILRPELTGYEMVVASSNNAAVNNISEELPKTSSLDPGWQHLSFIRPTAQKIAYQDNKRNLRSPNSVDSHWGLISCALGKSSNRYNFKEKFYFSSNSPQEERNRGLLHIRDWISAYQGPSFDDAKRNFLEKQDAVEAEIESRGQFVNLLNELNGETLESFTSTQSHRESQADAEHENSLKEIADTEQDIAQFQHEASRMEAQIARLENDRPGWVSRLFRLKSARKYSAEIRANKLERKAIYSSINARRHQLKALSISCAQAQSAHRRALEALRQREALWETKQLELDGLKNRYPNMGYPMSPAEFENNKFQINGIWNDPELSILRAELLQTALALHEAWLADVGRRAGDGGSGFNMNLAAIPQLLGGHTHFEDEVALTIWQSLFMVVPVVSTTFASLANQFKQLGQGSLGWLFIDEAGQAVPQAGVGALWRANNAVIVGDPLQIEPVFTVPTELIRSISSLSSHTEDNAYAPDMVSAQNLADAANKYGAYAFSEDEEHPTWIGSPLRVHRRCVEPMFTVSNTIAYGGTMVYGLPEKTCPNGPPIPFESAWIDIPGEVSHLQVVPEQIDFVVKLVIQLHARTEDFPLLYIITPFKSVKKAILDGLITTDWAIYGAPVKPSQYSIKKWCLKRVGTVHTFQGKEEDCVIMVLGADSRSKIGAAKWAASKPNLLNVAITRAKKRCFIVGDKELWAKMQYFPTAQGEFKQATPENLFEGLI